MMSGPVPALHKTDNAYKPGETLSDDPEEEKRQKAYKSHLNKLTPDNFDRLCDKILQVPVEGQKTLVGFINQIFDKALAETTFCELYASLCERVNPSMPKFPDPESEREINFKRVLLNKCQEEFERGDAAMKAIAEKEKADKETGKESGKEDAEKEVGEEGKDKDDEEEEGEIVEDDETKRKREEIKKYKINLLVWLYSLL